MERIVSSAIRYRDIREPDWKIVTGRRHADCVAEFAEMGLRKAHRDPGEIQGFMTDTGRFVDRKEAMVIARAAGQLLAPVEKDYLLSEDVW